MPKFFNSLDDVQSVKANGTDHLGAGSFSKVNLVCHKRDPAKWYAMKEVSKKTEQERKLIFKEITLHMSLEHQNIIKFEDYIETNDKVYIFLEYAKEGDLFGYIKRKNPNEQQMIKFFYQTCVAIEYIHSKNIMHRDLKPENILLDANLNVKLCDFGWSAEYMEGVNRETLCGTYEYMAPEIFFRNKQTKKTDIWALGILLYELYNGYAPFRGTRMDAVMQAIMQNTIAFKKNLAPEVKDLILKILIFDPKKRLSIEDILNHDLITNLIMQKGDKSPEKENYLLKDRYISTEAKNPKKRPDVFSNSFFAHRTVDNDSKSRHQPLSMTQNSISMRTPMTQKFLKPTDLSLFLKKKTRTDDFMTLKQYASVDRVPTENKNVTARINNPNLQSMTNSPISNLYSQRTITNTSFSNNMPTYTQVISQRTIQNPPEFYNYSSNQIHASKPDTKDLKYTNIYTNPTQNSVYNFVKPKVAKNINSTFTNYFSSQNKY